MRNQTLISITIGIITLVFIMFIFILIVVNFKDTLTIPQSYCESSGGVWNFYECYHYYLDIHACDDKNKIGYWCDYPDGTSKSEKDIEYILNSTEWSAI